MTQGKYFATITPLVLIGALAIGLSGCATPQGSRDRIVKPTATCVDQTVQIYFEPTSAEVTQEARAVLAAGKPARAGCKVTGVDVLGLSDAVGGDNASNLALSMHRAAAVTQALEASGLPAAEFKVSAAGQSGATTTAGQAQPLRRRVDVVIHVSPL